MENKHTQQEISEEAKKRAANYMSLKGALESKKSQYVDFSNPNTDKITSGTTNKPMENKKQTAVDWLIEQLTPSISLQQKHIDDLKTQAKEMEKEQIKDAFYSGYEDRDKFKHSDDYYDKM